MRLVVLHALPPWPLPARRLACSLLLTPALLRRVLHLLLLPEVCAAGDQTAAAPMRG